MQRRIWSLMAHWALPTLCAVGAWHAFGLPHAAAVGLNYVDASANPFGPPINIGPEAAIALTPGTAPDPLPGVDNKWLLRTGIAAGGSVLEAGTGAEDAPELVQTITGLTSGVSYDLYAAYWSDDDENWTLRAGVSSGNLTLYNYSGGLGAVPLANATPGISAAGAVWDTLPPGNTTSSPFVEGTAPEITDRRLLLGKAGTVVADVNGEAKVYMDDLPLLTLGGGTGRRSWIDGVAYVAANTQISLTATVGATGTITVNNPTTGNFQIKSYSLTSTSSSMDASVWAASSIAGHRDGPLNGGNSSFDTDEWSITAPPTPALTPFASLISEAEDASGSGSGGTLAAGGALSFTNTWIRTPFQDVRINLTLTDDSIVTLFPTYATTIAPTDFNANGTPDLTDFQTLLNNINLNLAGLTRADTFLRGDTNDDGQVNYTDFAAFRTAYDIAHGSGAFELMAPQVPEPGTAFLALLGLAVGVFTRRRSLIAALALVCCLSLPSISSAVPFLLVDVDDRQADADSPGPPGSNTVAGFSSFQIPGTGAATSVSSATGTVDGYSITMTSVNASGTSGGNILSDRDRLVPTVAPTLNQLYDDFIFVNSSAVGFGMDLTISSTGTAAVPLLPNTQYQVSVYSFDGGSNTGVQPRVADWTDGSFFNAPLFTSSFNGTVSPSTDAQYKYTAIAKTDATGKLLLKGRSAVAAQAVFVNGIEVGTPVELTLQVNPLTGATSILNEQASGIDISYYEIRSANGSLNAGGWSAFDDGEPGPDPLGTGWDKVPSSNNNILSEANLQSMLTVNPGIPTPLGSAFQAGFPQDVRFYYGGPNDTVLRQGMVKFVTSVPAGVTGDYNNNGVVDAADYVVWRNANGTSTSLPNDSTPGTVNSADYDAWRANFGKTPGSGAGAGEAGAVPEPTTCLLGLAMLSIAGLVGRTRRS